MQRGGCSSGAGGGIRRFCRAAPAVSAMPHEGRRRRPCRSRARPNRKRRPDGVRGLGAPCVRAHFQCEEVCSHVRAPSHPVRGGRLGSHRRSSDVQSEMVISQQISSQKVLSPMAGGSSAASRLRRSSAVASKGFGSASGSGSSYGRPPANSRKEASYSSIANTKQDKPLLIRLTCGGGRSPRGAHSGWIGIGLRVIIVA